MRILGLDCSTYTGLAVIDSGAEDPVSTKLLHFGKLATGMRRAQLIARACRDYMEEHKPEMLVFEALAYGNTNTLVTLTEIQAVIKLQALELSIPWWEVPPTVLKLWTTGKGGAKKPDMAKHVEERWGFTSKSDDVVDAYALARFGDALESGTAENFKNKCIFVPSC